MIAKEYQSFQMPSIGCMCLFILRLECFRFIHFGPSACYNSAAHAKCAVVMFPRPPSHQCCVCNVLGGGVPNALAVISDRSIPLKGKVVWLPAKKQWMVQYRNGDKKMKTVTMGLGVPMINNFRQPLTDDDMRLLKENKYLMAIRCWNALDMSGQFRIQLPVWEDEFLYQDYEAPHDCHVMNAWILYCTMWYVIASNMFYSSFHFLYPHKYHTNIHI